MEPIMPKEVIRRKGKIGFNTPIIDWMRGPWKNFLLDMLHSQSFKESSYTDEYWAIQEFNQVLTDDNYSFARAEQLWIKLSPYFWEQSFLNQRFWKPQSV
jgi:asparagine synthase (glutamine-hydrolysing)